MEPPGERAHATTCLHSRQLLPVASDRADAASRVAREPAGLASGRRNFVPTARATTSRRDGGRAALVDKKRRTSFCSRRMANFVPEVSHARWHLLFEFWPASSKPPGIPH